MPVYMYYFVNIFSVKNIYKIKRDPHLITHSFAFTFDNKHGFSFLRFTMAARTRYFTLKVSNMSYARISYAQSLIKIHMV